jgi:hypothetical protein
MSQSSHSSPGEQISQRDENADLGPEDTNLSARFHAILDQLDTCFDGDFRSREDEILAALAAGSNDNVFLRLLLQNSASKCEIPSLQGTQSFLLTRQKHYYIRINLWLPEDDNLLRQSQMLENYYSINVLHNHNFHLFTVGLFGPGYTSQFYRCEDYSNALEIGDTLKLMPAGTINLSKGETRYIEIDRDFHSQSYPQTLSISANLIPLMPGATSARQYIVDHDTSRIANVVETALRSNPASNSLGGNLV